MPKVDIETIKFVVQRNEPDIRKVAAIMQELELELKVEEEEKALKPPAVKKQNVIMISDPNGELRDKDIVGWGENDRGVSFTFGEDVVAQFLRRHDLDLICRAHQVVEDGYEFFARRQLVTIFSAPNYCGEFDNAAGMLMVNEELVCSFKILKSRYWK